MSVYTNEQVVREVVEETERVSTGFLVGLSALMVGMMSLTGALVLLF
jgi:hypothetical protein